MVKKRLIACLLWRDGILVQSRNFKHTNAVGNAFVAVEFFNNWAIDEIVLLNVTRGDPKWEKFISTIRELSRRCFVPLAVGGYVKNVDNMRELLKAGADKIVLNTEGFREPDLISEGAKILGNQCIVISIDVKKEDGMHKVFINQGSEPTDADAVQWAKKAEEHGAGEIFLTSIDNDGSRLGYDLEITKNIAEAVKIPVIASGGVGGWQHFVDGIIIGGADAVSAANIFHYMDQSTKKAKNAMKEAGIDVRDPFFFKIETPRIPKYINY